MTFKYGKTAEIEPTSNNENDSSTPLEIIDKNFDLS